MTARHTPGPWRLTAALGGAIFGAPLDGDGADARLIVEARHVRPNNSADRAYDLCLIEAAPDLLAALEAAEMRLALLVERDAHKLLDVVARDQARAAITKARGEA